MKVTNDRSCSMIIDWLKNGYFSGITSEISGTLRGMATSGLFASGCGLALQCRYMLDEAFGRLHIWVVAVY